MLIGSCAYVLVLVTLNPETHDEERKCLFSPVALVMILEAIAADKGKMGKTSRMA